VLQDPAKALPYTFCNFGCCLLRRYEFDLAHAAFFQRLMSLGTTLVSSAEDGSSAVSQEAAQAFLAEHTRAAAGAGQGAGGDAAEEEEDEFAGLE
jgi:hypothetical protein